ncbi:MAG: hypothetical protein V4736_01395 [Bdellovibrionota bacterium]
MKRWIALGFTGLFLMFQFQNCEQGYQGMQSPATNASSKIEIGSGSPVQEKQMDYDFDTLQAVDSVNLDSENYRIDLASGRFKLLARNNQLSTETYCLSENEKVDLGRILSSVKVCEGQKNEAVEICAQVYKFPYARLVNASGTLPLGEGMSSCVLGPDICTDSGSDLQQFLDALDNSLGNSLANRICD